VPLARSRRLPAARYCADPPAAVVRVQRPAPSPLAQRPAPVRGPTRALEAAPVPPPPARPARRAPSAQPGVYALARAAAALAAAAGSVPGQRSGSAHFCGVPAPPRSASRKPARSRRASAAGAYLQCAREERERRGEPDRGEAVKGWLRHVRAGHALRRVSACQRVRHGAERNHRVVSARYAAKRVQQLLQLRRGGSSCGARGNWKLKDGWRPAARVGASLQHRNPHAWRKASRKEAGAAQTRPREVPVRYVSSPPGHCVTYGHCVINRASEYISRARVRALDRSIDRSQSSPIPPPLWRGGDAAHIRGRHR
jgi:hypothetical protein